MRIELGFFAEIDSNVNGNDRRVICGATRDECKYIMRCANSSVGTYAFNSAADFTPDIVHLNSEYFCRTTEWSASIDAKPTVSFCVPENYDELPKGKQLTLNDILTAGKPALSVPKKRRKLFI